jgi:tetratricopeptide (TPR) repeat protein
MLSLLCVVVVFGAHSLIDWTWYVPGDACVALICAGWLAGRGPLSAGVATSAAGVATGAGAEGAATSASAGAINGRGPTRPRPLRAGDARTLVAAAAIVAALLAAWSQWQPQRSEDARAQALALLATRPVAARAAAETAVSRNPLSVEALFTLAEVQSATGEPAAARATLEHAVRLQPSNPETWLKLGRYDLANDRTRHGRETALKELQAAIFLNPSSISPEAIAQGRREAIEIQNAYVEALRGAQLRTVSAPRARATGAAATAALRRAQRRAARRALGNRTRPPAR